MSEGMGGASSLAAELVRMVERVRPWAMQRWAARATGREGSRADVVYDLVRDLAAACPATPPGAVPDRLRDLALADQLAVVGTEMLDWLHEHPDPELSAALLTRVHDTRDAIESAPLS